MSYVNRKFGHSRVSWVIEGCCLWFLPRRKNIESPDFIVRGKLPTKWKMAVKSFPEEDYVKFQLTRLSYGDDRDVWVHLILSHIDLLEEFLIFDHQMLFHPNETAEKEYRTWDAYNYNINLRLKIIVYDVTDLETVPECEDLYLRQLSKDMKKLYERQARHPVEAVRIETSSGVIYADLSILLKRINNPEVRAAAMTLQMRMPEKYTHDDVDKVMGFLFSADIAPAVTYPQIGTYDLAEQFQVQPLVTYYQPDYLALHSTSLLQEFTLYWTISKFASRKETCLISPKLQGELYHCVLKIFPDVKKTNRGNIGVNFEIYLAVKRHVCMELSLKTENFTEKLIEDYHKTFEGQEIFGAANTIKPENLTTVPIDGSATIELHISLSDSPENSTFRESIVICQPYCDQQNYINLSRDMFYLYCLTYFNQNIDFGLKMQNLLYKYRFFLETRNFNFVRQFLDKLQGNCTDLLAVIKFETLDQVVQFMFSGRFSKELYYKDIFYFYELATKCEFDSLKNALVDELKMQLSAPNVKDIFNFAMKFNIDGLVCCIRRRFH